MTKTSTASRQSSVGSKRDELLEAYRERLKAKREAALKAKLWAAGRLRWKLKPEQRELYDGIVSSNVQLIYGDWSRRGGKSFVAATYTVEEALRQKIKIRFGTAFRSDLEEFIIPTFDRVLEDCPDSLRPRFKATRKVYEFRHGSEIKLVGLDKNPNGLRGNDIQVIVIDEAGFVSKLEYIYKSVIMPATMRMKKIKIIILSTPPVEGKEHFAHELKLKAEMQGNGFYHKKTIDELSDVDESEKERLFSEVGGQSSDTAQREFYCVWKVPEGLSICPTFDPKTHVMEFPKPKYANWLFAGDMGGVRDLSAGLSLCYSHDTGLVHVWDESIHDPKFPTSKIVEGFRLMIKDDPNVTKVLDAPGITSIDLSTLDFPITKPEKAEFHTSLTFLRNAFYRNEIVIHPRCEMLIRTLENGLLNKARSDFQRSITLGHCDAAMALIYGLRALDKSTDQRPKKSVHDNIVWKEESGLEKGLKESLSSYL
jgi:hypothetical protein